MRSVLVLEKTLYLQILGRIMDGMIWLEGFTKISNKIMAVIFRFGEGVARSNNSSIVVLFCIIMSIDVFGYIKIFCVFVCIFCIEILSR